MKQKQYLTAKNIAKVALLPGIIPRIKELTGSGFAWIAQLMAVIYYSVRLLPKGHPYLNPANKGRFGIRDVIALAASNIEFKKENTDQIIVFGALLVGTVLLFLQFAYLIFIIFAGPAFAGDVGAAPAPSFTGLFSTPVPTGDTAVFNDIAFMLMDSVFGIPDIFNSCVANNLDCQTGAVIPGVVFPSPVQTGLHSLLEFYSFALLLVGVFIFLYYVTIMIAETAQTGTPFGKRFNSIWAPIRLVVALGLLVPVANGLNSSQYITLYAAKWGSGFATNAWITYNRSLSNALGSTEASMIVNPSSPEIGSVLEFIALAKTCEIAIETVFGGEQYSYGPDTTVDVSKDIKPYLIKAPNASEEVNLGAMAGDPEAAWKQAIAFYGNDDIVIRFGQESEQYKRIRGQVFPFCGEIKIFTTEITDYPGPTTIQAEFYKWVIEMWEDPQLTAFAMRMNCIYGILDLGPTECLSDISLPFFGFPSFSVFGPNDNKQKPPPAEWFAELESDYQIKSRTFIELATTEMKEHFRDQELYSIPPELLQRGWAGAAIWYNEIASWNGGLMGTAHAVPLPVAMPELMEFVEINKKASDNTIDATERYNPYIENGPAIKWRDAREQKIAVMMNGTYKYLRATDFATINQQTDGTGNAFFDVINVAFGTHGLFNMRDNDEVHPLAQLSALGKGIIEASIRNMMTGLAFSVGGGFAEGMGGKIASAAGIAKGLAQVASSFSTIGLTTGFLLYYVLPFLPFIYFFFAVSSWIKTIFEAMVGAPLWALAHLRIDGNGLPGDTAMNGYLLIFEIFLRPILIIFGFIGGIVIFAAMVRTLNSLFTLVTENLAGFDCVGCDGSDVGIIADLSFRRSIVDEFFFTVVYTMLVYMIAKSSFKLIDQVPNKILRWMSGGVDSFGDQDGDPAGSLVQYAAFGGNTVAGQLNSALGKGGEAVGKTGGSVFGLFNRNRNNDDVRVGRTPDADE